MKLTILLLAVVAIIQTATAQGQPGVPGVAGPPGLQGPRGLPGSQGLVGRDGRDGLTGRDGKDGEKGDKGDPGMMGPPGTPGEQGANGPTGRQGTQGPEGPPGAKGEEGERGPQGIQGANGQPGPLGPPGVSSGGTVYTRWGRTTCPNTSGTELVYNGTMAASYHRHYGGGANHLCLPNDPQPLYTRSGTQNHRSKLYGVEYDFLESSSQFSSINSRNAPCAVCATSQRSMQLMIPAKPTCPSSWTLEYAGYLVAERHSNHGRVMFQCIDSQPDLIPGSAGYIPSFHATYLYFTEIASCGVGIPCPPYSSGMELSCAVCTK